MAKTRIPETICLLSLLLRLISSAPATTNSLETENDSASISTSWLSVTTPQPRNTEARRDNTSTTFTSESTVARLLNAINALNESLSPKSKVNETYEQTVIDQQQSGTTQEPLNYFNATHSFNKQHDYDNSERLQLASTEISYNSSFHAADNSVHDFGSSTQQQQQQPSTHNSPQESEYDKSSYSWTNNGYFTSTEFSQQSTYKDVVNDHAEHLHSSSVSDGQTELIEASFLNAYETPHYQDPLSTIDGRDDSDHPTDGPTEIFAHEPSDSPTYDNYDNGNSSPNQDQVDINSPTTETNVNKGDIINDGTNVFFDSRASATTITTHTQQAENHDLTTINETDSNVSGTEYTPWISNDEYQYAENTTSSWDEQRNHVDLSINDGLEPKTAFNRTETSNDFSNSSLASINDEDASTSSISDQQVTDNNENDEKAISTRSDHSTPEPVTVQEHQTDYYKDLTAGVNTAVAEIVSSLLQDPVVTTTKTIESSSSNSSWNENVSGEAPTTKGEVSELSSLVSEVNDTENAIVEHTTLSGVDVFVNTPLENLINASVITAMDLSTVTSIINPQSSSYRPTDVDQVSYEANFNSRPKTSCIYNGQEYSNGQNIDQLDPCHFCVCVNGYLDCYWKNCPPPPEGCMELEFEGVCDRSLYLCPIPKQGEPLPFPVNSIPRIRRQTNSTKLTCNILEVEYKVGELVGVASDPCMECRCAVDSLYCSPKCCFQPVESALDPTKNSRANDAVWQPILTNPLKHLRSEFQSQQRPYRN